MPASPYSVSVPSESDLAVGIGEFFAAYLAGAGEVGRYLAPGVRLSAVTPAPYTAVTVQQLLAVQDAAAAERVPADGTTVLVCAQVEARDAAGRWPLAYELTLKARSGRWEVAALETPAASGGAGGVMAVHSLVLAGQLNDLGNSWITMFRTGRPRACRPVWSSWSSSS